STVSATGRRRSATLRATPGAWRTIRSARTVSSACTSTSGREITARPAAVRCSSCSTAATRRECWSAGSRPNSSRSEGMVRPAAVVFDLDGTLIDSRHDITAAINLMRADLGLPPLALEQVVTLVGEGARRLIERALPERPDAVDHALARYLEHYSRVCLETTRPYPGV